MSSDSRGSIVNTNRKGKIGRWYIRPQLVSLEFCLNVPQKSGQILFFGDPCSLRSLLVCCKIRGMFIEKIEVGWGAEVAKEIEAARERAKLPPLLIEGGFSEDKDLGTN